MRAITGETGTIVALADYEPFGQQLSVTGTPGTFTYNGNEYDDEYDFDLYYFLLTPKSPFEGWLSPRCLGV